MRYHDLSDNQLRVAIDCKQVFSAYTAAKLSERSFTGGMQWKSVGNHEYLIRITNRFGGNKSLGPRNAETEKIYADFIDGKSRIKDRVATLRRSLEEMAGMSVGVGINRVPVVVGSILRSMEERGLLGKNFQVIGTHAMYAYESAAGVLFDPGLIATTDIDFMWDAHARLKLASADDCLVDNGGFIDLLRSVDKTFEPVYHGGFRAVNGKGFFVDLVRPTLSPPWKKGVADRLTESDLVPSGIDSLRWLISGAKFQSVVIDSKGFPAPIVAPDPRAFAMHKMWLSKQDDRDPEKKKRDCGQAMAVAHLIEEKFPHLSFDDNFVRIFPREVRCAPLRANPIQNMGKRATRKDKP